MQSLAAPISAMKARYRAQAERALESLSEIERRDAQAFDRWLFSGRGWIALLAIIAVNLALAAVVAELPWNMPFVEAAVLINVFVLALLWSALTVWFGYRKFHGRLLRYILAIPVLVLVCAFCGAGLTDLVRGGNPFAWLIDDSRVRHVAVAGLIFSFLYILFTSVIVHLRNREYAALATKLELERRESDLSRQLAESKLRLLQLQIEPHFLFNTLGSAQQLAQDRAPEAARLIGDLITFLRAATPSLREDRTTLADDAALCRAYLRIMKLRLGTRLRFDLAIPKDLESFVVPPGMLITLVENAIKHGIEPYPPGGEIRISAVRNGEKVVLTVADTGAGLDGAPGHGIGLANIRERLELLYRTGAGLSLGENAPHGFVARVELPIG